MKNGARSPSPRNQSAGRAARDGAMHDGNHVKRPPRVIWACERPRIN